VFGGAEDLVLLVWVGGSTPIRSALEKKSMAWAACVTVGDPRCRCRISQIYEALEQIEVEEPE